MRRMHHRLNGFTWKALCLATVSFLGSMTACSNSSSSSPATTTPGPQNYFGPPINGLTASSTPELYTIDPQANPTPAFSETDFVINSGVGQQVVNSGNVAILQRGLRALNITASYSKGLITQTYPAPGESGSYAVELANQAGGLVQMLGRPVVPVVAATQCPSFSSTQTYQFITIPNNLYTLYTLHSPTPHMPFNGTWTPTVETAYGSVDITSSSSDVTFKNIQQYILPSVSGTGQPSQPSASSVTGSCGSTVFGYTTQLPGQLIINNPTSSTQNTPPQASVGIGPSGLLVEWNGYIGGGVMPNTSPPLYYENVLGAGTGAVGLPKPSSALSTSAVVGAQYLGFIYSAGVNDDSYGPIGESSEAASFGFPSSPSGCPSVTASTPGTPAVIYGGDFPSNDPTKSSGGYGNCDFAIDLGVPQDSSNSLYTQATVTVGAGYGANATKAQYSFKAVAIAGQLAGKYAIFVIGFDGNSTSPPPHPQPWAIYLLQSN